MTRLAEGRPAPIRIDDLAQPRFAPHIAEMLGAADEMAEACDFTPDAVCSAAVERVDLDDFGDADFLQRLGVLCQAYDEEADLSATGRVSIHMQLVQFAVNRLLVEDAVRRHPEILDIEVRAPIVIAGLPRTGTTHLHNLLSADPALRYLPYWEAVEPVLADAEQPPAGGTDPRLERTEAALRILDEAMPHFKRMHEMTTWHAHEEIHLLAIDFSSMYFETLALIPSWRDHYRAEDQTPRYAYLKKVLQVLQWLRGGERWVLKSPQHLEQFGPLMATFPDAVVAVTHRDPVAVTASLVTMLTYTARMQVGVPDPEAVGAYWSDRVAAMLRECVDHRDVLPDEQSIDVGFDEFMADDMAMVERVYELAGQPMTAEGRAAMQEYVRAHPRGRHGGLIYDLSEFGLDPSELAASLAFYAERFGVGAVAPGTVAPGTVASDTVAPGP